jgi:hypothetical protein
VFPYTGGTATWLSLCASRCLTRLEICAVVDTRIKPYLAQVDAAARREVQRKRYKRNQVFGLMLVAAAILIWWLFHTNSGWIFPPGWWRL